MNKKNEYSPNPLLWLVENTPIVTYKVDSKGVFRLSEGQGLGKLGLKSGEVVGLSIFDVYKEYEDICSNAKEALKGKQRSFISNINNTYYETYFSPCFEDGSGKVTSFIGISIDISNRIIVEEALVKSKKKYRELIEFSIDGILIGSKDEFITDVNNALCLIAGRKKSELIGMNINELINNPLRFDLLIKGETVLRERPLTRPDGSVVIVEIKSKMMPDGYYQSVYRDVTQLKINREELIKSRELVLKMFNTIPILMAITTIEDGCYKYINETFTKVTGYAAEEVIGKTSVEINLFSSKERERFKKIFHKQGFVNNFSLKSKTKKGAFIGLLSAETIVIDSENYLLTVVTDITELD